MKLATFLVEGRVEPIGGTVDGDRVVAFAGGRDFARPRAGAADRARERDELRRPRRRVTCAGCTWVNGELRQDSSTSDLIFGCDELVEFIGQTCTLVPGDLILTGTPSASEWHWIHHSS